MKRFDTSPRTAVRGNVSSLRPEGIIVSVTTAAALAMIGVLTAPAWQLLRARRRRRAAAIGALGLAFSPRELRALDAQLQVAAADELARLERELAAYVSGVRVGYVVAIIDSVGGVALELSDGQRLSLGGVAQRTRRLLSTRASFDLLRPSLVERDGISWRLLLRGHRGDEVELHARRLVLAAPTD
jgi:hypothetical protein